MACTEEERARRRRPSLRTARYWDVMHCSGSQHPVVIMRVWQHDLADLVGVQTVHAACVRTSDYTTGERADVGTGHIFRQHCSSRIQMELEPPSTISRVRPNTLWIRPPNYDDSTLLRYYPLTNQYYIQLPHIYAVPISSLRLINISPEDAISPRLSEAGYLCRCTFWGRYLTSMRLGTYDSRM